MWQGLRRHAHRPPRDSAPFACHAARRHRFWRNLTFSVLLCLSYVIGDLVIAAAIGHHPLTDKWLHTAFFQTPDVSAKTRAAFTRKRLDASSCCQDWQQLACRVTFERLYAYVAQCSAQTMRVWTEGRQTHTNFLTGGDVGSRADGQSQVEVEARSSFSSPKGRTSNRSEH